MEVNTELSKESIAPFAAAIVFMMLYRARRDYLSFIAFTARHDATASDDTYMWRNRNVSILVSNHF